MRAQTWTATIEGAPMRVWLGPGALSCSYGPPGNALEGVLAAICRAVTVGLEAGRVDLRAYLRQLKGTRFEPNGATGDPLVPECSSLVDYLARSVEARLDA